MTSFKSKNEWKKVS